MLPAKADISSIMAVSMRVKSEITNLMGLETIVIHFKVIIMRDNGIEILHLEREKKSFQMVPTMMANSYMVLKMVTVDTSLIPGSMKGSSRMVILMEKALSPMLIIVLSQAIGLMV